MKKHFLGILSACILAGSAYADSPAVKDTAPERYTVKKGDTLWDISSRYLNDAWRWPEIWQANQQIANPHLIYPGDVLVLCHIHGQTVLAKDAGGGCAEVETRMAAGPLPVVTAQANGDYKLHPQIREQELSVAIPAIPLQAIKRYLNDSRVVKLSELEKAPYVVAGADEHIIAGAGDHVYVRGKTLEDGGAYGVYRAGTRYVDPDTQEILGYEATAIGGGKVTAVNAGVGTFEIGKTSDEEVRIEDKLLPYEERVVPSIFEPHNPAGVRPGRVIRVFGSIASAANNSVIVLSRGTMDGVRQGDTFALYQHGKTIVDRVSREAVRLPSERKGLAMVFRTFDRVSYALVLRGTGVISVGDEIRPPVSGD